MYIYLLLSSCIAIAIHLYFVQDRILCTAWACRFRRITQDTRHCPQWAMIYIGHKFSLLEMRLIEREEKKNIVVVWVDWLCNALRKNYKWKWIASRLTTNNKSHAFTPFIRTQLHFCEWILISLLSFSPFFSLFFIGCTGRVCWTSQTTRYSTKNWSGIFALDTVRTTGTISNIILASTILLWSNANNVIVVNYQF